MSDLFLYDHFVDPDNRKLDCEVAWNGTTPLMPDRSFDGKKQLGRYALEGEQRQFRDERKGAPAHQGPKVNAW